MIEVDALSKTFTTHRKEPGLMGSVRSLFRREKVVKQAVRGAIVSTPSVRSRPYARIRSTASCRRSGVMGWSSPRL